MDVFVGAHDAAGLLLTIPAMTIGMIARRGCPVKESLTKNAFQQRRFQTQERAGLSREKPFGKGESRHRETSSRAHEAHAKRHDLFHKFVV
ncbi:MULTISPECIES: hypothetical protein [unclassified Bradyrhizobium]|uniref:hypothetical protein n=1 Tax=unclassified Bradyrhizobium TaxID=2631580 RepID=UPI00247A98C2|nr:MULTISPECIES: hypothetical protein [unclassified Bradyrhizobium]WGS21241.1 hypothetical protein MTX22_05690 [Bradyrhizobium sp. ISRA463]WGS28166.1 hypothetical protein MTX19_03535 [Bradyrhizobium sp. ISRA464]